MSYPSDANTQFPRRWGDPETRSRQPGDRRAGSPATELAVVYDGNRYPLAKMIWHRLVRRQKVLVSIAKPPARLGILGSLCLSCADGIVALPDVAPEIERLGVAASRILLTEQHLQPPLFAARALDRSDEAARRILYVGDFSPRSGVADLQACAIAWAERFPDRRIEIDWRGDGDLREVLQAQMAPANLEQSFARAPEAEELPGLFEQHGVIAIPSVSEVRSPVVVEAMAAGLPVLGSIHSAQVRALVATGKTGWTFDPLRGEEMFEVLDAVLTADLKQLARMREAARKRIEELYDGGARVAA